MDIENVLSLEDLQDRLDKAGGRLFVIHFWAGWAPQCKQMHSVLKELSKDDDLKDTAVFLQVESEITAEISLKYEITAVPTFVLIKNGKVVAKVNGANAPELTKSVRTHADSPPAVKPDPMPMNNSMRDQLNFLTNMAKCMVFMKGNPKEPKCGFSRTLVTLFDSLKADYHTFDILEDSNVRQGLKEFSQWPTYPQVYINGQFIGGLDVVKEMHESGELMALLPTKGTIEERLKYLTNKFKVMIFMKGNRNEPRCGFSRQLIEILNGTGVAYETFDILDDNDVREGLKTFSNWPTYPQIYVGGQLIGGLDIIKDLHSEGELISTLSLNA